MMRMTMTIAATIAFGTFTTQAIAATSELACTGMMLGPNAQTQETVKLTLGSAKGVGVDLGHGFSNAPVVSDNNIQLKFRTKEFVGEYFHPTGDLFLIYHTGQLARLTCTPT
jgi:hypothetical protein